MLYYIITNKELVIYKYNKFIGGSQGLFCLRLNHRGHREFREHRERIQRVQRTERGRKGRDCHVASLLAMTVNVQVYDGEWIYDL